MALLNRINAVCNLCKINRNVLASNVSFFRVDAHYLGQGREPPSCDIFAQILQQKRGIAIFRRPSVETLKKLDDIPDDYKLIYRNKMDRYLLGGQIITVVCASIMCATIILSNGIPIGGLDLAVVQGALPDTEQVVLTTGFIVFCTAIQLCISKMPIRIYYLPQQKHYIMILYRSLPFQTRRIKFGMNEVMKFEPKGFLPWNDCKYEIKNLQVVIMIENYFRRPADLNIMLGYQKSTETDD